MAVSLTDHNIFFSPCLATVHALVSDALLTRFLVGSPQTLPGICPAFALVYHIKQETPLPQILLTQVFYAYLPSKAREKARDAIELP